MFFSSNGITCILDAFLALKHVTVWFWKSLVGLRVDYSSLLLPQKLDVDRKSFSAKRGRNLDVYSFGVLVLELCSFPEVPPFFKGFTYLPANRLHENALYDADEIENDDVKDISKKCLHLQENDRINSKELLNICEDMYRIQNEQLVDNL